MEPQLQLPSDQLIALSDGSIPLPATDIATLCCLSLSLSLTCLDAQPSLYLSLLMMALSMLCWQHILVLSVPLFCLNMMGNMVSLAAVS